MKKPLLVFCSLALVTTLAVFAYNSDKGPAGQSDGISESRPPASDSLIRRGKQLTSHYSEADLKAIAAYLQSR